MTQNTQTSVAAATPLSTTPSTTAYSEPSTIGTPTPLNGAVASSNGETSKTTASNPDLTYHAVSLADFFFHVGYLGQNWTDIQLTFFDTGVALHRIILARCPYILRLIHNTAPGQSLHLSFTDDNITASSVHIALQHLYRPCLHLVEARNARAILATATLFEGMPELAHQAYLVLRESISPDTIVEYLEWVEKKDPLESGGNVDVKSDRHTNGEANGTEDGALSIGVSGSPARYGEYSTNLKSDLLDYLVHTLPTEIPPSNPRLTSIYSHLPYELFKLCVEHPTLPVGSMQDRFSFAKKVLAARKKLASSSGSGPPGLEETVALGFKDGASGVEVNRRVKKGRQFYKVEGN